MNMKELKYQIFNPRASAKCYTANIVIETDYSKELLLEIIKNVTWELRQDIFNRSESLRMYFGKEGANIVILFLYKDLIDLNNMNYICKSCWCKSNLPKETKQVCFEGNDDKLDEIQIHWNNEYNQRREFLLKNIGSKEDWIQNVTEFFPKAEEIIQQLKVNLDNYNKDILNQQQIESFLKNVAFQANDIVLKSDQWGKIPSDDYQESYNIFAKLKNNFSRIFIPFYEDQEEREWKDKLWIIKMSLQGYEDCKSQFHYK